MKIKRILFFLIGFLFLASLNSCFVFKKKCDCPKFSRSQPSEHKNGWSWFICNILCYNFWNCILALPTRPNFSTFTPLQKISNALLLSDLRRGDKAIIDSFTDYDASLKLLEMGCIPGEKIVVVRIAPLGDPIAILIAGYLLSMRKEEAAVVVVKKVD